MYITDRKRAAGAGASGTGTGHHWEVTITSWALAVLVPLFVIVMAYGFGRSYAEAALFFAQPFPALVVGLTLVVGMVHFRQGVQVLIEDYTRGDTRQLLIVGGILFSYAMAAAALWAVVRLAL